ncbi:MAG: sialidase family protein, partial [Halobacteriaceae archaeon]
MADDAPAVIRRERDRTDPDYVTYVPGHWDGSTDDGLNEHFLVVEVSDGLVAVWTQASAAPGFADRRLTNRVVVARSEDGGESWSAPTRVAGPAGNDDDAPMASWAVPLVSDGGRVYLVYNRHRGTHSWIPMHCGTMAAIYSDDGGRTWSDPRRIPMPDSPYDDPDGEVPPEWIAWQKPTRDRNGDWLVGYTHWVHEERAARADVARERDWTYIDSVVEFVRFTNVHDEPAPGDLAVRYSGWGEDALTVPHHTYPDVSVAQEPSLVRLPDGRLFATMRTATGCVWWSQSADDGETWADPRPLRYRDHGDPVEHPVAPAPVYGVDGRYVLLF